MTRARATALGVRPSRASSVKLERRGHFSDTYKAVILEAGVGYIATRDPRPGCDQDLGRHMSETSRRVGEAELLPALRAALAFRHADPACAGSAVDAGSAADNRTLEVATLRGGSHT